MAEKNNDRLFFTCSLIEFMGRRLKRSREEITDILGKERLERIYEYADVFHCEPMERYRKHLSKKQGRKWGDLITLRNADIRFPIIGISERYMNG